MISQLHDQEDTIAIHVADCIVCCIALWLEISLPRTLLLVTVRLVLEIWRVGYAQLQGAAAPGQRANGQEE